MKRIIRRLTKTFCSVPGTTLLLRRWQKRKIAIIMYHGFVEQKETVYNWCLLPIKYFNDQVAFLKEEYKILPLREVVDRLNNKQSLPDYTACITFDDAFRSLMNHATPLLREYNFPATIFAATNVVDRGVPAWTDYLYCAFKETARTEITYQNKRIPTVSAKERSNAYYSIDEHLKSLNNEIREDEVARIMEYLGRPSEEAIRRFKPLNWDELNGLLRGGLIDVGSHTHRHPILSRCSEERQREELEISARILKEKLDVSGLFAYPNGGAKDFTKVTMRIAEQVGYKCALSTVAGLWNGNSNRYAIPRVNVGARTDLYNFIMLMSGL